MYLQYVAYGRRIVRRSDERGRKVATMPYVNIAHEVGYVLPCSFGRSVLSQLLTNNTD